MNPLEGYCPALGSEQVSHFGREHKCLELLCSKLATNKSLECITSIKLLWTDYTGTNYRHVILGLSGEIYLCQNLSHG